MYPQIYIGTEVPPGWATDYPTLEAKDAESARRVLIKYYDIKGDFILGIDMRGLGYSVMTLFLKFMETTTLKLVFRANEAVPSTILSRCFFIKKTPIVEKRSPWKILLGERVVATKILELK